MKKKITTICEQRLKVYYPADEWATVKEPERVLLDIPCDNEEEAQALKENVIAEEAVKISQTKDKSRSSWMRLDDIEATLYWAPINTTEEPIN